LLTPAEIIASSPVSVDAAVPSGAIDNLSR
jgi:hypothetical protein